MKEQPGSKGRPSPRWAFFERYDIQDWKNPDEVYLRRWRLVETPWFGIFLHKIMLPDHDRALHDHPYSFVALILRGGYNEIVHDDCFLDPGMKPGLSWMVERKPGHLNFKRAEMLHRIHSLRQNRPAWTLLVHGPRRREWGFWDGGVWRDAPSYIAANFISKK